MEDKELEALDNYSREKLEAMSKEVLIDCFIKIFHVAGKAKAKLNVIKDILEIEL